jgi:hypothetical protein
MPIKDTPTQYRNEGLEMAAMLLVGTAEDLEQTLPRRQEQNLKDSRLQLLGWKRDAQLIDIDAQKARLLRGQALRIRELMK